MDNDDVQVGKLWSRREVLALMSGAGVALIVGCSGDDDDASPAESATNAPTNETTPEATADTGAGINSNAVTGEASMPLCIVTPELTEGPYFVDERLERSDIRTDPGGTEMRDGAELNLTLTVYQVTATGCETLEGAMIDVWHCDALGRYSDVRDNGAGFDTTGEKWLRGFQTSDASGQVSFTTIYPGWYQGRATHIHFKVRKDDLEFTSQFFFDDALSDEVHSSGVYAERGAEGRLQNDADNIYGESGGQLLLNTMKDGEGFVAAFGIGLQM